MRITEEPEGYFVAENVVVAADRIDRGEARPVKVAHPAIDEFGEGFVVYATPSGTVRLTKPLALFLSDAVEFGLRPVLLTRSDAAVSGFVSLAMRRANGVWAAQEPDRSTFDALSGFQIGDMRDLFGPVDQARRRLAQFGSFGESVRTLTFDVTAHRRPAPSTKIGTLAEAMFAELDSRSIERSGQYEPLTRAWNVETVTALMRQQMPESLPFLAGDGSGAFVQTQVNRTRVGLLEHVQGGVPVAHGPASTAELIEIATRALEKVADQFSITMGFVSISEFDQQDGLLVQRVHARPPESPLVVLIGNQAVRDGGLTIKALASFDVQPVGTAAILVRFSKPTGLWDQMGELVEAIGAEKIGRAMGLGTQEVRVAH